MSLARHQAPTDLPTSNLAAAGTLAEVLFRTTVLPFVPPMKLVGLQEADEAIGPPGRSMLPPFMTHICYTEATRLELSVSASAVIAEPMQALLLLRDGYEEGGVISIGMARLTQEFVRAMFAAMQSPPPPLLKLDEAAELMRISPSTLKHMVSDGRIRKSVRRGTPLVFVRDLLVQEWMGES